MLLLDDTYYESYMITVYRVRPRMFRPVNTSRSNGYSGVLEECILKLMARLSKI